MSLDSHALDPRLGGYLRDQSLLGEGDLLARLRRETAGLEDARMQISVEQGRLMEMLTRSLGVRRAIEVGVFTGYSSLCVAMGLPADGKLVACDVSEEWTDIARRYWREAGVEDRIDLRLAPAGETLRAMIEAGETDGYDFAFVDADKEGYPGYFEQCLALLRPGGVLAFDNMFMGGGVVEPAEGSPRVVRELSDRIFRDQRVDSALVPIGDGLLLARKREDR